eukprot:c13902_g1_i1.p1 GENE.c13902_g1_i1~~c13902_g1_i1.p1  ORF type:complete len:393 (+),score=74.79 c13902_g1_i1:155-1180(+)
MIDVENEQLPRGPKQQHHDHDTEPRDRDTHPARDLIRDHRNAIITFLKAHMVHELMPASGTSVILDSELTARSAFFALQSQDLTAAPIWDSREQRLTGMLTVSTFTEILLRYTDSNNKVTVDVSQQTIREWLEVLERTKKQLVVLEPDSTLYKACEELRAYRFHRVPVVEEQSDDQCVLFVVDHLKMLKYLLSHLGSNTAALSHSIGDLGVGSFNDVVTCHMDTPLADVLRLQHGKNLTAFPVVDEQGVVLDIVARHDVLCVVRERLYEDLNIKVRDVLALRHRQAQAHAELSTCLQTDSLLCVFQRLAANNTHRLIIVDGAGRLEGVVSLSDMFGLFLDQ